jgi:hypothetical protein
MKMNKSTKSGRSRPGNRWRLQDAKARLSEVVRQAQHHSAKWPRRGKRPHNERSRVWPPRRPITIGCSRRNTCIAALTGCVGATAASRQAVAECIHVGRDCRGGQDQ